ncbi:helix-turn-helix transcriptional regulator [Streptomyces sp. WAC07149]|uniref:helix-turn-helix domain-containing protein n=1 Tax=Streptomyces sp. WAC07149 TaxID=2487425 RepID=UPI00163C3826|nr:helix-turn-helix transcriptional regulator [Streptomyces sp. WAC07149]
MPWQLPSSYVAASDLGAEDDVELFDPITMLEPPRPAIDVEEVRVQNLRKLLKLSQDDVAKRMEVSRSAVGNFEQEESHVPGRLASYLAALGYRLEMYAVRQDEKLLLK